MFYERCGLQQDAVHGPLQSPSTPPPHSVPQRYDLECDNPSTDGKHRAILLDDFEAGRSVTGDHHPAPLGAEGVTFKATPAQAIAVMAVTMQAIAIWAMSAQADGKGAAVAGGDGDQAITI